MKDTQSTILDSTFINYFIRGGPFDTWGGGGAMGFLCNQTFFRLPAKTYIFFRPYLKQTLGHETSFSPYTSLDSPHILLFS